MSSKFNSTKTDRPSKWSEEDRGVDRDSHESGFELGFKKFGDGRIEIARYVFDLIGAEDAALKKASEIAESQGLRPIHLGRFDVRHLEVFVRMAQAKKIVEIGTLGGYSALAMARASGVGGEVHTFEKMQRHAKVAEMVWREAGTSDMSKIYIYLGDALKRLPEVENRGPFDMVFIDADKGNYSNYFDWAAKNVRAGGVIIADNTFAFGFVHLGESAPEQDLKSVRALHAYNQKAASDPRFLTTLLPTAEGLTLSVRIS
jgi:caffeoyl-CoA O-methyltransferase